MKINRKTFLGDVFAWVLPILVIITSSIVVVGYYRAPSRELAAAVAGGDYLLQHLDETGKFDYLYDPLSGQVGSGYNILRHAGTTYSLLELYEATGQKKYLIGAERAIDYLLGQTVPCGFNEEWRCVVDGSRSIKLGGNGLALLVLAKHIKLTNRDDYLTTAKELSDWIISTQLVSGEFSIHIMSVSGESSDFISSYYPGEALFGLIRFYEITGEDKYLVAAKKAAHWLIEVRDQGLTVEELNHDHWLLYGLNDLYQYNPDPLYIDHVIKIVEAIKLQQHRDRVGEEYLWNGGYYSPPRSTPTATRSEGLVAAYSLLARAGYEEELADIYDTLKRGIDFQLRTQITEDKIRSLKLLPEAIGGFSESLSDLSIRIDYVQHNISALLGYERIKKGADFNFQ